MELDGARYLNFNLPFSISQLVWIEAILVGGAEIYRNRELDPEARIYPGAPATVHHQHSFQAALHGQEQCLFQECIPKSRRPGSFVLVSYDVQLRLCLHPDCTSAGQFAPVVVSSVYQLLTVEYAQDRSDEMCPL